MVGLFQASFTMERRVARETVLAVINSIFLQRALGSIIPSTMELAGVSFPCIEDFTTRNIITEHAELVLKALDTPTRKSRVVLALYSTPASPSKQVKRKQASSNYLPVQTALGWFRGTATEEEDQTIERDREDCGNVWEQYIIDFELITAERRSLEEEKLRSQLNDFILKLIAFVNNASNVPPIVAGDILPFGIQILIDPRTLPHPITTNSIPNSLPMFPLLHQKLVSDVQVNQRGAYSR